MIVVTDTSVVPNLCCIGLEHLLPAMFGKILAPVQVKLEFERLALADQRFLGAEFPEFIEIRTPTTQIPRLEENKRLHHGEIQALTLVWETSAGAVLMDERAGRSEAHQMGLKCIGIVGILIQAKNFKRISSVTFYLDDLCAKAGFWMSNDLRRQCLDAAGE